MDGLILEQLLYYNIYEIINYRAVAVLIQPMPMPIRY